VTVAGAFLGATLGGRSTLTTELMVAIPFNQLQSMSRDPEQGFI
jgi:hypothetical protein